jgi:ribonucleoside-diphosphate reductase alpha chain
MPTLTRERLPTTRVSLTHKFEIGDHDGYIIVGLYNDGRPGEVYLKIGKEGSTLGGLLDCIGILTSVALQHGVPVETLIEKLSHVRFEPSGLTKNRQIPQAKSLVDYIFRWMETVFVDGDPKRTDGGEE